MTETNNGRQKIVFGEFQFESESRTLRRGGEEIHLAKRPFDVLRFLIENRRRVVGRDELLDKSGTDTTFMTTRCGKRSARFAKRSKIQKSRRVLSKRATAVDIGSSA